MSVLDTITGLLKDPPPAYIFELSEAGVAYAAPGKSGEVHFREFEPGVLTVSPGRDNVAQPEAFATCINSLVAGSSKSKRRTAALIVPDHSARVQVLDFDSFPGAADEQVSLIRFRVKKSVPFDVESAAVSYFVQPPAGGRKIEVVAAVMSLEILARYEAAFRNSGYVPGLVTTSSLAALNLMPAAGLNVLAKLSGKVLSVIAMRGTRVKLVRTVELEQVESEEVLGVLYPTLAYLEDEMSSKVDKIFLCGFGPSALRWSIEWEAELGIGVEPLQSRNGTPGPFNAGLLGYLETSGVKQ